MNDSRMNDSRMNDSRMNVSRKKVSRMNGSRKYPAAVLDIRQKIVPPGGPRS
jgi:hypothetical protein